MMYMVEELSEDERRWHYVCEAISEGHARDVAKDLLRCRTRRARAVRVRPAGGSRTWSTCYVLDGGRVVLCKDWPDVSDAVLYKRLYGWEE